jgi:hypothetical protein
MRPWSISTSTVRYVMAKPYFFHDGVANQILDKDWVAWRALLV